MSLINLHTRKQRIVRLIALASDSRLFGKEEHQYLCRYVCIRLVVYLDKSLSDILSEYCKSRSATPQITKVVNSYIKRNATNLNCQKIRQILDGVDSGWAEEFEQELSEDETKFSESKIPSQLSSLKNTRDKLAHGDESTIHLGNLKDYFESVNVTIDCVKEIVLR